MSETSQRWRVRAWGLAAGLWLLPLAMMQISDEMRWDAADFAAFALLLLVTGLGLELLLAVTRRRSRRLAGGAVLALGALLVWAHGAVGVF
jgi:hypothetical protein